MININVNDYSFHSPKFDKPKHITILYNRVGKKDAGLTVEQIPENDILTTALHIEKGLKEAGFEVSLFEVMPQTLAQIPEIKTDLFFNSCFGVGSLPKTEYQIPQILDQYQKPYTGGNSQNIVLTTDKFITKILFLDNNLPTPKTKLFKHPNETLPRWLKFPLIVKPSQQDASLGICAKSVVTNRRQLNQRISHINKWYQEPALIEEFVDGREFNVSIVGNKDKLTVLPISEITYGPIFNKKGSQKKWRILSFAAKWLKHTKVYQQTTGVCPTPLPKDKEVEIKELAKKAFLLTNCRDYARVDIRMKDNGLLYILEVNANPSIDNEEGVGFVHSAKAYGLDYPALLTEIVAQAWKRYCPDFVNREKETRAPTTISYLSNLLKTD